MEASHWFVVLTLRAAWSSPPLTAGPHRLVHNLALHLWGSKADTWIMKQFQFNSIQFYLYSAKFQQMSSQGS